VPSERLKIEDYPSTVATSTVIIFFSETFKISKIISSRAENFVKHNNEYLGIFQHCEIDKPGSCDNNRKSEL
jgi:hypothetical protein